MTTLRKISAALFFSGSLACGAALAQSAAPTPAVQTDAASQQQSSEEPFTLEGLRKKLIGRLGTNVSEVSETAFPGLYEAIVGPDILYTDKNADFLIMGQLFDTKTQRNLTAETKDRLNKIDFSALPLDDAIKVVQGNGSRRIAVFSDPYCTYCKKLEATLKDMNDVTIYTFLYPVIRANSREQSEAIWCAKDRGAAWRAQMIEGKSAAPKDPKCDTSALDRNIDLGGRLQVTGTPTVFVPNGQRAPGAVSLEYLEKMLAVEPKKN